VEMNQVTTPSAYIPMGLSLLQNMGVPAGVVSDTTLEGFARKARGSLRDYTHAVIMEGIMNDGLMP
jgi:hypothetical protein